MFQYRDPVIGVLDYIVDVRSFRHVYFDYTHISQKKCLEDTVAEDTVAIAHDDDLHRIKDAVRPSQSAGMYA